MANARNANRRKGNAAHRDAGGFIALPWAVVDSPAFTSLSVYARALLLELARQYVRDNNGRLLLTRERMAARGWTSNDTLTKARRELEAAGVDVIITNYPDRCLPEAPKGKRQKKKAGK